MARVAVIGGGPAGVASAIQLARAGHDMTLYEKGVIGGTVRNARLVENYPGFPKGIDGAGLALALQEQLAAFVQNIHKAEVKEISLLDSKYIVNSTTGSSEFDAVILCTGTKPKTAGIEGERELAKAGLLHYEVADLRPFEGFESVGIIGGGEASMDHALYLSSSGKNVTILFRSRPRGIKALYDKARADDSISWKETEIVSCAEQGGKVMLESEDERLIFDRILVAVGRERAVPELRGMDNVSGKTFVMAGDVNHGRLGQVAIAVGEGVKAAIEMDIALGGGE